MAKSKKSPELVKGEQKLFGPGRGGAREGAGRPPKGKRPRVTKSWTVDQRHAEFIEEQARIVGSSQSDLVNELISRAWFDREKARARLASTT